MEAEEVLVAEVEFESAAATAPTRKAAARKRTVAQRERAAGCMSEMVGRGRGKERKGSDEGVVGRTSHVLALRRAFTAAREREAGSEDASTWFSNRNALRATLIITPAQQLYLHRFAFHQEPSSPAPGASRRRSSPPQVLPCAGDSAKDNRTSLPELTTKLSQLPHECPWFFRFPSMPCRVRAAAHPTANIERRASVTYPSTPGTLCEV